MLKKLTLTVLGVLLVAGALIGTKLEQFRTMGEAGANMMPPPQVVTAAAQNDTWESTLSATGSLFTLFVVPSLHVLIAKDHASEGASDETALVLAAKVPGTTGR